MLREVNWSQNRVYRSFDRHEPAEFYLKSLANSVSFDLLLGYFSTSAINVLSLGFATFIYNGGTVRIVANHILSKQDKDAILAADNGDFDSSIIDLTDINNLASNLDEYSNHFFNCISYLLANKRIELVLVAPKGGQGISHFKSGAFHDGKDTVGFKASCNFTYSGIARNLEEIEIFLLWENARSSRLIAGSAEYFENLFSGNADYVDYIDNADIKIAIRDGFQGKDLDELLVDEEDLLKTKMRLKNNPLLKETLERHKDIIQNIRNSPKFPFPNGPRNYQVQAYKNWIANNKKGIFAMATGTGKTITSLNCLFQLYMNCGYYKALIFVPTKSLVDQWEKECERFNFTENIIKVYSLNDWQAELSRLETIKLLKRNYSFIIISTYSSFTTKNFQRCLNELDQETLLIADECHTMGSPTILRKLKSIYFNNRIGLSATPNRQYQEETNNKIREFFGEKLENNYTFSYTMEDAIKKEPKALCPYRYYPQIVRLTDSEFQQYVDYTRRIVSMQPRDKDEKEIFKRLCIARQRIIHKAENKLAVFKSILEREYSKRKNLKYTLVYVPEGLANEDVIFDPLESDELQETSSDRKLLNLYTRTIAHLFDDEVTVKQFIGVTAPDDRKAILNDFANGKLQVITSMKCLDEGIDVPRSELAIFCASTGNPRQFIQRRGRVLRLSEGKDEATIYDLVVVPDPSGNSSLFRTEQREVEKELRRVRDFAEMSENKHYTRQVLEPILNHYNLNL